MNLTIDLTDLPDEVTDYAFDQFDGRLNTELDTALEAVLSNEPVEFDYEAQCIRLNETLITRILETAMMEKIRDIEYEVEHDERDDYTLDDVRQMRNTIDDLF